MKTIEDIKFYDLKDFDEENGHLVPIEQNIDIPFEIKRVFYVYGVNDKNVRGQHSHFLTQQVLICLSGKVEVTCYDGKIKKTYILDKPNKALLIPEMIWDEQIYLSEDSILLSFCSTNYDRQDYIEYNKNDYITDLNKFKNIRNCDD